MLYTDVALFTGDYKRTRLYFDENYRIIVNSIDIILNLVESGFAGFFYSMLPKNNNDRKIK